MPRSGIQTYPFQIENGGTRVKFLLMAHLMMGALDLQILDQRGMPLSASYSVSEHMYRSVDIYLGDCGLLNRLYQLQINERNVVGRYRVVVACRSVSPVYRTLRHIGALLAY